MSTAAVEINDAGILIDAESGPPGENSAASPGYAQIDGRTLLTGVAAERTARLKPRRTNNRFWSELDRSPLPKPFPDDLTHADLAHAHLSEAWQRVPAGVTSALLVLPGSNTAERIGLVLGIARACGIPVHGLVDSAVAASTAGYAGESLLHLDIQLHRVVLTRMSQGHEVVRERVQMSEHTGLARLSDAWVKKIAASFVNATRFDPMHEALSEQALYDLLPATLARIASSSKVPVQIETAQKIHAIELARRQLEDAVAAEYEGIVRLVQAATRAGEAATLLLSDRIAALPGLAERVAGFSDIEVVALSADAAVRGGLDQRDNIRAEGEALPLVTRLPVTGTRPREPVRSAPTRRARGPRPTHVVYAGRAFPITTRPLAVGLSVPTEQRGVNLAGATAGISRLHCSLLRRSDRVLVEDHSTYGSFLNGQRVEREAELAVGDRLRVGSPGIELQLIAVEDDDETTSD